ncbi:MAG: hypothetical protein RR101_12145 [Burkholderiaceae bacterium]
MKKAYRCMTVLVVAFFCATGVAQAQWVFLGKKAVGVVRQMAGEAKDGQGAGYDSAAVLLEARAEGVYRKALEVIAANPEFHLGRQTDHALTLEFTDGKRLAGLQVIPLGDHLSQLLIVSNTGASQRSSRSMVVKGVLRICQEMGVRCELSSP